MLYLCFCFDLSSLFLSIASSHLLLEICQSLCNIAKRKDVNRGLEYNIHCLQDTIFSSYTFINLWCSVVAPRTFALSSLRRICESAKLDGVRDDNFTFGQNSLTMSIFSDSSTLPEIHHLVFTLPYTFASSVIYPDIFHISFVLHLTDLNDHHVERYFPLPSPPLPSFVSSNLQPLHTKRNSKSMFLSLLKQTMLYIFICLVGFDMRIRDWMFHCRCVVFLKLKILGGSCI